MNPALAQRIDLLIAKMERGGLTRQVDLLRSMKLELEGSGRGDRAMLAEWLNGDSFYRCILAMVLDMEPFDVD